MSCGLLTSTPHDLLLTHINIGYHEVRCKLVKEWKLRDEVASSSLLCVVSYRNRARTRGKEVTNSPNLCSFDVLGELVTYLNGNTYKDGNINVVTSSLTMGEKMASSKKISPIRRP